MTNDLKEHIQSLDIQELRLINGDHIIGEIVHDDVEAEFVVKDPVEVTIYDGMIRFIEYLPYVEDQYFVIERSHIIASGNVDFETKAIFVRSALVKKVKRTVISKGRMDELDAELIAELNSLINGGETSAPNQEDEPPSSSTYGWEHMVDTSTKH